MFGLGFNEFVILGIILFVVGAIVVPRKLNKDVKARINSPKWKLRIGSIQLVIAFIGIVYARGHSPYRDFTDMLVRTTLKEEVYIPAMMGLSILALLGIGNIIIGVLKTATENRQAQNKSE